jgi:hypothetical protein
VVHRDEPVNVIMRFCVSTSTNATSAVMMKKRNRIVCRILNFNAMNLMSCIKNGQITRRYQHSVKSSPSVSSRTLLLASSGLKTP